jgi:hypothetical protein
MDLAPNTNHAGQAPRARVQEQAVEHLPFMKPSLPSKILVMLLIVSALVFILSAAAGVIGALSGSSSTIKSKQYQAVFLTNGQVYFGKLADTNNSWVKLTDIFYLQVQQQVQPSDSKTTTQQPQVSLAKLGNELHGPEDVMYVDRSQVLFWENLKNDGKVVNAIKDYKNGGNK